MRSLFGWGMAIMWSQDSRVVICGVCAEAGVFCPLSVCALRYLHFYPFDYNAHISVRNMLLTSPYLSMLRFRSIALFLFYVNLHFMSAYAFFSIICPSVY